MTTLLILIGLTILMLLAGFPLFACFGVGGLAMMFFLEMPSGFAVPAIFSGLNSFVLMAIPFFIFAGGIMDDISAMLLAAPLLYPLFMSLDIHPFQMAAIMAINQGSGQMTPPVATNLFTAARVSGVPVSKFVKYCVPFLLFGSLPILLLVTFIPELSTFLPTLLLGK